MHSCYVCAPASPGRIYTPAPDGGLAARVPARFAGPPRTANGGVATGALICPALTDAARAPDAAHLAASRVTARLHRALPLERDAAVTSAGDGPREVTLHAGEPAITGTVHLTASDAALRPGDAVVDVPPEHAAMLAVLVHVAPPDRPSVFEETGEHPIPGCFSCGPANPTGLAIYPRAVEDGTVCAPWTPAAEFDDGGGALAQMVIAAALDCVSGIALPVRMQRELLDEDRFYVLGSYDVRFLRIAPVDRDYRVAGRMLRRDGRKFFALSVLSSDGVPYAMAEATWIISSATRAQAFGGG